MGCCVCVCVCFFCFCLESSNTFVKEVKEKEIIIQRKGSKTLESIPCSLVVSWRRGLVVTARWTNAARTSSSSSSRSSSRSSDVLLLVVELRLGGHM